MSAYQFHTIEEAIEDFRSGKMVIIVDDGDEENDGVLAAAGEYATPELLNFMLTYGRGLITMPISEEIASKIGVGELIWENRERSLANTQISIDSLESGHAMSAADRSRTIMAACQPGASPAVFRRPGSMFPKVALRGGVMKRAGFTEATVDLAVMSGLKPVGVRCGILDEDGAVAKVPKLLVFAREHDLKIITIADMIKYRRKTESFVSFVTPVIIRKRMSAEQVLSFS